MDAKFSLPEARGGVSWRRNGDLKSRVFSTVMLFRLLSAALLAALLIGAQTVRLPPATFSGTVHAISGKQITIETAEGNLLDFDINRKTKIMRGKKQIEASDLETGDTVTIDAREEMGKFLVALVITAQPKN
jgi:hypothetical protein